MIKLKAFKYLSVSALSLLSLAMGGKRPDIPAPGSDGGFDRPEVTRSLEEPAKYTSTQLRDRARQFSFSSRSEFESMVNAKLNARLRYLNLIPHLSMGSALAIGTFSGIPGLLGSIGDLAPFLLPSRWIQARESSKLYRAQQYSVAIMQLDSMQIVEGLSMFIGRDCFLHDQLKMDRALHSQLIQEVQSVEDLGKIAPGSSLAIAATANMLDQTISSLESQLNLEMTDLARAAGFINPSAISSLVAIPTGDIQQPGQLDLKVLQSAALSRAPELSQMQALMEAAKLQRESRFFQWLDPQGDSSGGLGFGLPSYVEIGQSNFRQLLIAKDQLNSSLLRKITDAYNDYLGWIDSYRLAVEGVDFQTKRISYARKALQSNFAGSAVEELREAAEQLYVNHANLITAEYAWYVALSRVNRLSRQGPYDRIAAIHPIELK